MELKKATLEDISVLNEMFTELYRFETRFDPNSKIDLVFTEYINEFKINSDLNLIYIAYEDNKPVGYIQGYYVFNVTHLFKTYYINTLFVYEEYRNRGIATSLINTFIDEAKKNDCKYVTITNYADNIEAKKLYSKFGFDVIKEERCKEI